MTSEEQGNTSAATRSGARDSSSDGSERIRPSLLSGTTLEGIAYAVFAFAAVLWAAGAFFGPLESQLLFAQAENGSIEVPGPWVSPSESVYHDFNLSRSSARGFFFNWSEGKGYAPNGAGHLYPLLLALGYRMGFVGDELMFWAAQLACLFLFLSLLLARDLARKLAWGVSFLFPLAVLGVGRQTWAYFSGSNAALFLLVWLLCAWLFRRLPRVRPAQRIFTALGFGVSCALLVSIDTGAIALAIAIATGAIVLSIARKRPLGRGEMLAIAGPVLVAAGGSGLLLRSYATAAPATSLVGSLASISSAVVDLQIPVFGVEVELLWLPWLLATVPVFFRPTRTSALLIWASLGAWLVFGGGVSPRNPTASPAITWLCLAVALGIGVLVHLATRLPANSLSAWSTKVGLAFAAFLSLGLIVTYQLPLFQTARWNFAHNARDIYASSLSEGRALRSLPQATAIAVAEPGSLVYAADLPAVDLSGSGGFERLPLQRAADLGSGATLELLQAIADDARPTLAVTRVGQFADLTHAFGTRVLRVPSSSQTQKDLLVHRLSWQGLQGTGEPVNRRSMDRVVGRLDFANLVSERDAKLSLPADSRQVHSKLLTHPNNGKRLLWDAGRELAPGAVASFELSVSAPQQKGRLIIRLAPHRAARLQVNSGSHELTVVELSPDNRWQEVSVPLPTFVVETPTRLTLRAEGGSVILYNVWLLQRH